MRREFSAKVKVQAFQRANGCCEGCGARLTTGKFEYDHINPDGLTGSPVLDNCRVVCVGCHRTKTRNDIRDISRAKRRQAKHLGAHRSSNPFPCGRQSKWKKKMDGSVVLR
ncbi:MAG: HNH endonuclease [Acidobacteriaceae bacterium]|nr:HNH endonuclease [Acidobacteriaceae bacterium]